jgi:hypothetical protein
MRDSTSGLVRFSRSSIDAQQTGVITADFLHN